MPFAEGTAGLRLVASVEDFGGWIDNSTTGVEDQNERDVDNYRGKFRWMPTDRLDIVLSAWRMEQEGTGDANSLDDRTTSDVAAADYEDRVRSLQCDDPLQFRQRRPRQRDLGDGLHGQLDDVDFRACSRSRT